MKIPLTPIKPMEAQNPTVALKRINRAAYSSMLIYAANANALPICLVRIADDLSLTLTQSGLLGFIVSIVQFVILIASFILAARFGKLPLLRMALAIMSLGLIIFSFTISFKMGIIAMLILGSGNALLEALLTPLIVDIDPANSGSKVNLLHAFWPIGVIFSVIIVGELLSLGISWRLIFAGLAVMALILAWRFPARNTLVLPSSRSGLGHLTDLLSRARFWQLGAAIFFSGGAETAFAFWSASYIPLAV